MPFSLIHEACKHKSSTFERIDALINEYPHDVGKRDLRGYLACCVNTFEKRQDSGVCVIVDMHVERYVDMS